MTTHFLEPYYSNFFLQSVHSDQCSHYKKFNWSVSYFLQQWEASVGTVTAGTIVRYGKLFHVNFTAGTSLQDLKELAAINPNYQISLSFRKSGNLPAIVIVADKTM